MISKQKTVACLLTVIAFLQASTVVSQVQFNLRFDPESGFFDPTDWSTESDGQYATYGDALRGELQSYLENVIAPAFGYSEPRVLTIDITDGLSRAFASASTNSDFKEISPNRYVSVPKAWDILVHNNNPDPTSPEGTITYNLDVEARYSGDRSAMLRNIAGGLTRHELMHVLGIASSIPTHRDSFDPRGLEISSLNVYDHQLRDLGGAKLVDGYRSFNGSQFENPSISRYELSNDWSSDESGLHFAGIADDGRELNIPINSSSTLIDFDHPVGSFAGLARQESFDRSKDIGPNFWDAIIELDRALLRKMGYQLAGESQIGDFDEDGDVDADDIDFYSGNVGQEAAGELANLDLDWDDVVGTSDHYRLVTSFTQTSNGQTGTLLGDVNLDGRVNVLGDAFILVSNLNAIGQFGYADGDLNADGDVTVLGDAFLLISNLGESNTSP